MGLGQNFMTKVGSDQFFVARVGSAIFGLGLLLEFSPKNPKFFNFFPLDKKNLIRSDQKVPWSKMGWPPYLLL